MKGKIMRLLKSPILEDTIIGLCLLTDSYNEQEIIEFFDDFGDTPAFTTPGYLSYKAFKRYEFGDGWQFFYKEKIGFYVGYKTMLVRNELSENQKLYNPTEL